jgi:hypothetical protein
MSSHDTSRGRGKPTKKPGECHYIPGLLAVPRGQAGTAIDALGDDGLDARDVTDQSVARYAPGLARKGSPPPIDIIEVPERPHRSAARLANRARPMVASPIHGVGYESHAGYMAGEGPTRPTQNETFSLAPPEERDREGWIAVVDSGLVDQAARPEWIREPHVRDFSDSPETVTSGYASHGTFVTSIIRKVAPDYGVLFSAAPPDLEGKLAGDDAGTPPTTELDVLGAIDRLVSGIDVPPHEVKALNLSLGAPRCDPDEGFLLTLRAALELWRQEFGNHAPIFAAGGNSDDPSPVYPAAFDPVRGVGAGINGHGDQQVWADDGSPANAPTRAWIDDVAPGLKILGAGGVDDADVVWWSGSSFASAVASALYAKGASFEVKDGVVFWQDTTVGYDSVVGLQYA